jgi:chromosome partitioning protein
MFGNKLAAKTFYHGAMNSRVVEKQVPDTKIIAFASQKGGTGKTTSAQTLSVCLARYHNKRVLAVDLDPQGCFGAGLLTEAPSTAKTADRMLIVPNVNIAEYILPARPNLDLVPNLYQADLRDGIERMALSPGLLRRLLRPVLADYDYVVIDTPAGLSRSTQFGLDAADQVILVLSCSKYALQGVSNLLDWLIAHCHYRGKPMPAMRVILNNFDARRRFDREFKEEVEYIFGDDVFRQHIRPSVKVVEAAARGVTVIEHSEHSGGALDFKLLSRELLGLPTDLAPPVYKARQPAQKEPPARPALRLVS